MMRIRMIHGYRKKGDGYYIDYASGGEFELPETAVQEIPAHCYEIMDECDTQTVKQEGALGVALNVSAGSFLDANPDIEDDNG